MILSTAVDYLDMAVYSRIWIYSSHTILKPLVYIRSFMVVTIFESFVSLRLFSVLGCTLYFEALHHTGLVGIGPCYGGINWCYIWPYFGPILVIFWSYFGIKWSYFGIKWSYFALIWHKMVIFGTNLALNHTNYDPNCPPETLLVSNLHNRVIIRAV